MTAALWLVRGLVFIGFALALAWLIMGACQLTAKLLRLWTDL